MARSRKKTDIDNGHEASPTDAAVATDGDDVFGRAIAAAATRADAPPAEGPPAVTAPALNGETHQEDAVPEQPRRRDTAVATDKAAKMKLYSNHQNWRMAIVFEDGKPSERVRDMLKSAGFSWSRDEGAWEKPTAYETRVRDRLDAERLFAALAEMRVAEMGEAAQAR